MRKGERGGWGGKLKTTVYLPTSRKVNGGGQKEGSKLLAGDLAEGDEDIITYPSVVYIVYIPPRVASIPSEA